MERLTEYEQDEFDGTVIAAPKYERTQMGDADLKEWAYRAAAKLAYYEDAEEQGRLVKLPFTFGDIIYEISESRPEIFEWTIKGFQIFEDATYICVNDYAWINFAKLGKTIFHTLDEARAKLKEMENNNAENHETE